MVVIVDDDEATRESLRFLLECEGLEVQAYPGGHQLLAAAWPPDAGCMVLDVNMPGMSGLDILTQLRTESSDLPVIIVTGQPSVGNRERALAAGAIAFLEKPINDGRLVELVHRALKGEASAV